MSGVEVIKVKQIDDGMRLNRWFLKYYPSLTLGRLQKLLRTKQIKVDGKKAEANLRIFMGQEIRVPRLAMKKPRRQRILFRKKMKILFSLWSFIKTTISSLSTSLPDWPFRAEPA